MPNRHTDPKDLPLPQLLGHPVPLTRQDIDNGVLAAVLTEFTTYPGVRELPAQRQRDCLAVGLGYATWDDMLAQPQTNLDTDFLWPRNQHQVFDILAWRMYRAGFLGLADAVLATTGAMMSTLLDFLDRYSFIGNLNSRDPRVENRFSQRCVDIPSTSMSVWVMARLTPDKRLYIRYRHEAATDAASYLWTDDCGISMEDLVAHIESGAVQDIEDAISMSWFSTCWPVGLAPVQYMDSKGKLFGYGWDWSEIGSTHALVFKSVHDFKKSAACLWKGESSAQFAATELPEALTKVDFVNPWDPRDLDGNLDPQIKAEIEVSTMDRPGPWVEVVPTREGRISLGTDMTIGNEPWTRQALVYADVELPKLNGLLGLVLPTMEEVTANSEEESWVHTRVPYGLTEKEYQGFCRISEAISKLIGQVQQGINDPDETAPVRAMMRDSCHLATPGYSAQTDSEMQGTMGMVAHFELPRAGYAMRMIYPELDPIGEQASAEYALAYFGKDGLNDEDMREDTSFMRYCILRNLGLDPNTATPYGEWLGVYGLVRNYAVKNPDIWTNPEKHQMVAQSARFILMAIEETNEVVGNMDGMGPSRLEFLGLS